MKEGVSNALRLRDVKFAVTHRGTCLPEQMNIGKNQDFHDFSVCIVTVQLLSVMDFCHQGNVSSFAILLMSMLVSIEWSRLEDSSSCLMVRGPRVSTRLSAGSTELGMMDPESRAFPRL